MQWDGVLQSPSSLLGQGQAYFTVKLTLHIKLYSRGSTFTFSFKKNSRNTSLKPGFCLVGGRGSLSRSYIWKKSVINTPLSALFLEGLWCWHPSFLQKGKISHMAISISFSDARSKAFVSICTDGSKGVGAVGLVEGWLGCTANRDM